MEEMKVRVSWPTGSGKRRCWKTRRATTRRSCKLCSEPWSTRRRLI
ncbi:hypothetical protein FOFC_02728 [Fusarium oxysporum]|nr:hypothetical protein FOFC_02728 [Fusarium oxysporum]